MTTEKKPFTPPKAQKHPHPHQLHNDVREDDYYWIRDRENPEVITYLEAENAYYDETMRSLEPLTHQLFEEMKARIPETEQSVPAQHGPYFYYARMEKSLQYPVYARKKADSRATLEQNPEEVVLNLNEMVADGEYLSVTVQKVSPDHARVAYLENRDGSDRYTALVKDLSTGELLADKLTNVFIGGSLEWDAKGEYLFYVTIDESQRPYRLWRHKLGDSGDDILLYEESDISFTLTIGKSRDGQYLFAESSSKTSSEVRYLNTHEPLSALTLFAPKQPDIQYELEHWGDNFLVLTNEDAPNFKLLTCPVTATDKASQKPLFPYEEGRYLQAVDPFEHALVISGREEGLTQVWTWRDGSLERLSWQEPIYTVSLAGNRSYTTDEVLIQYQSMLTPRTTYGLNLETGALETLLVDEVPGSYDASQYRQERLWATAKDGTKVPMAAVYKSGSVDNGPAPTILYGYGSYGANTDPRFDGTRLPLLDRGMVYVIAQIRGGSEMGRPWYDDGKMLNKRNTFTDFIDAAEFLIDNKYTTPDKLAAIGRSAGGLLMGAVANMGGHLFKALLPGVPFVDVVTTMLDETIPLTSLEWDEWGNPKDAEYYTYIKSYSPYDNVEAKDYPHMLVTTGLNDPRVAYWEPAKWVARLRELKTDSNTLLLKTHMGAGHFGSSGRFNRLKESAAEYAFLLDKLGIDA